MLKSIITSPENEKREALTVHLENETRQITTDRAGQNEAVVALDNIHSTTSTTYSSIKLPVKDNTKLACLIEKVNQDVELQTVWKCANINAVDRLGISDHGRVHVQIVANIGLKMLRLLKARGVEASIVKNYHMTEDDAEIVVVLAALLHDIGICVHRDEHEHHSLWLAERKIRELLDGIYGIEGRTVMMSEILHAVVAHARSQRCLTLEAGVVKVADALDMAKGRSRIPFEQGHINIHSVSAAAIECVELRAGEVKPIHIQVRMSNSAGIYQIDELLKRKIQNSTLKDYIELSATIEAESEQKLVPIYEF